jgi:hypothetical protein
MDDVRAELADIGQGVRVSLTVCDTTENPDLVDRRAGVRELFWKSADSIRAD